MNGCKATLSFAFCLSRSYIVSQEVTVVCKELKEWVCQVVGKDHFIPLSIRQREAPILTLLMLEVTSFPNPFKVGWWNEPPKNKSQIGGRFCLILGMIEIRQHVV